MIAGDEMAVLDVRGPAPFSNPSLADFLTTCPAAWQGDTGFLNWCTTLYNHGITSVPQTAAPTLTSLSPSSAPANVPATLNLVGTGFDPATVKVAIVDQQLTPNPTPTATGLSVTVPAASIPNSGMLRQISVVNGSGAVSNSINLYVL